MKYLKQLVIILAVCLMSEVIVLLLPLGIPASIIAMILLFIFLTTRLIKEEHIAETADFLLQLMPIFILPSTMTIVKFLPTVQSVFIPLIIVCGVGAIVTFLCSFFVTKFFMKFIKVEEEL